MASVHSILTVPASRAQLRFWFGLSLFVAVLYSIPGLLEAFSSPYVIQDDARQHVFWMRRFLDPDLFPNDVMADYFQSVAPWGYSTLYWLFSQIGIDPVTLNKLLPPILGIITTIFCFGLAMQILPLPLAGFTAATLLNQNLWMRDDLSSATPGAFFYPIFTAFLYFLLRQSLIPCLITIALQGLFYPQGIFLSAGLLILHPIFRKNGKIQLQPDQMRFSLLGLAVAALVILAYAFKSSEFGSVIRLAEARSMPAFSPTGWSAFFSNDSIEFWLCGKRSGMLPSEWCYLGQDRQEQFRPWLLLRFPSFWLAALLPVWLEWRRTDLVKSVTHQWNILPQGLTVSVAMFFLAHILAFKLHLPNRYTEHGFRIFLALAAGLSLVFLIEWFIQKVSGWSQLAQRSRKTGLIAVLIGMLIFYPYSLKIDNEAFPITGYFKGKTPDLYEFFARQPKGIQIASLTAVANQIPTFSQRSLFVGGEGYVLPYHPQYYQQVSQKLLALIQVQYSPDLSQVKEFIRQSGVDFWLLDQESFQPDFADPKAYLTRLFQQFPQETQPIQAQLQAGQVPALSRTIEACSVLKRGDLRVLRTNCILQQ